MSWQYTPYVFPVLASTAIAGALAVWGWRRRPAAGATWFAAMLFAAFLWSLFYALEIISGDLAAALFFSKMQYFGASVLAVTWLLLVLTYTGRSGELTAKTITLLSIVPLTTILLVWTNEAHHLIWVNPHLARGDFNHLAFSPGPWWWINTAYSYLLFAIATILLIVTWLQAASLYRRQIIILLIFSALTWLGNLAYTAGFAPKGLNLTAITFTISGVMIAWGLFRYRLMDISPVAYSTIVNQMREGLIVLDTQQRIVNINQTAQDILGQEQREIVGKSAAEVFSVSPALQTLWQSIQQQKTGKTVRNVVKYNGRSYEIRISPLWGRRRRPMGALMFWRDITRQQQAEEEIRQHGAFLQNILESIATPFYVINAEDYRIEVANSAARALGIGQHNTCYALTHHRQSPCDSEEHPCPLAQVKRTREPFIVEHIHYKPDGKPFYVEVHGYPILDEDGNVTQMIEYSLDITKRKAAEAEIRKLTRSVEQSASSVIITDTEGTIEYVNPAFERITGYSAAEAIGENPRLLKSGKMPPQYYQEMWQTLLRGEVWRGEIINRKKDGTLYWEFNTISPVEDEKGRVTHYVAIKEDITERKMLENALADERRKTDALLRNILPEEVAAELKQQGRVTPILIENATVLFADFGNFTRAAEQLTPRELVDTIDAYFTAYDNIIERHGLEKMKTIGDNYMCAGGVPRPRETHALDVVRAAWEMLEFVRRENARRQQQGLLALEVRIGISSGPVIAGVVGRKKYAYDIWGDTVIMAARMEQAGELSKINISHSTYELVREHFDCRFRGKIAAKHKGMVEMYFVHGPRLDAAASGVS